ncbi:hypothetical protein ACLIJJ_22330 [Niallia sp. BSM11]
MVKNTRGITEKVVLPFFVRWLHQAEEILKRLMTAWQRIGASY